jgi:hypothetical protein
LVSETSEKKLSFRLLRDQYEILAANQGNRKNTQLIF